MARANWSKVTRRRHKKVLKAVKGYRAASRRTYKSATAALLHARSYATAHRRLKKRQARSLAILRINAAVRERGLTYSKFMRALRQNSVEIDRKTLADLSVSNTEAFDAVVATVAAKGAE